MSVVRRSEADNSLIVPTDTMKNTVYVLASLTPFGLKNPNEVFIPTSEPFGNISATIARSAIEGAS